MSRKIPVYIIAAALMLLCACETSGKDAANHTGADPDTVIVYDLSQDMSHIEPSEYHLYPDLDLSGSVGDLLQRIIDGPSGTRARSVIPDEITSVTYIMGSQTVGVNFNSAYNEVGQDRKVLCEAAIVRTLCQLDDVYAVSFSVEGVPVCDSQNVPVGLLTPDSFVENDGSMINSYERAELHLFFADESGKKLVEKSEIVTYNSNISMDRLIVDNIVKGPMSTDAFATVNPATTVNSVMTRDGVCYVNLSGDFLNRITNVTDKVLVFSVVNSLTELDNVNKVQILIDGDMNVKVGEIGLSTLFERDLEIVE